MERTTVSEKSSQTKEPVCGDRLEYFGWRVTYCVLPAKHVDAATLHRSASGIQWCCNAKGEHSDDCLRNARVRNGATRAS